MLLWKKITDLLLLHTMNSSADQTTVNRRKDFEVKTCEVDDLSSHRLDTRNESTAAARIPKELPLCNIEPGIRSCNTDDQSLFKATGAARAIESDEKKIRNVKIR